jgi:hypothetical protein
MKRGFFSLIVVFVLPLVLINCAQKNEENKSEAAATPLTTACLTSNCNNTAYGQYPGFFPYPTQYQNPYMSGYNPYSYQTNTQANFCGCGTNAQPLYNNEIGMGCVYNNVIAPVATLMGYWSLPAANTQWVNVPQNSNMVGGGCSSQIGQSCFTNQPNSCGSGYICQSSPNSVLGVCLQN